MIGTLAFDRQLLHLLAHNVMHSVDYAVAKCLPVHLSQAGILSKCLSVHLPQAGILSKRLNMSSNFFHRRAATPF